MADAVRDACVQAIHEARIADYSPAAIDQCLDLLRRRLARTAGRDELCVQVESLLRARNGERAAALLGQVPLAGQVPWVVWLVAALAAIGLFVAGLLWLIDSRVAAAKADSQRALVATSSSEIDKAEAELTRFTQTFVEDLAVGRAGAAYAKMSETYQGIVAQPRFERAIAQNASLRGLSLRSISHANYFAQTAKARGTLAKSSGETVMFEAAYALEGGAWRLTGLSVGNVIVLPASP